MAVSTSLNYIFTLSFVLLKTINSATICLFVRLSRESTGPTISYLIFRIIPNLLKYYNTPIKFLISPKMDRQHFMAAEQYSLL